MPNQQAALDQVFHALADPTRRGMMARLVRGPATVSELAGPLTMALPSVVQHLRVLEDCGLVSSEKKGRVRTCRAEPAALDQAEGWITELRVEWENRLDRFEAYVTTLNDPEETP